MMTSDHVAYSCETAEHYTPEYILEPTRLTLGSIDLDPCSCAVANRRVSAKYYYTEVDNGLTNHWIGASGEPSSIFINPPNTKGQNLPKKFWEKLLSERLTGGVKHAVYLAYNMSALQWSQSCSQSMLGFPVCVLRKRVAFIGSTTGKPQPSPPPPGSAIIYIPGTVNNTAGFVQNFHHLGQIVQPL